MDCSPPDSSVHGVSHAGILEWVAMPSFRGSFQPRDETEVSHIVGGWCQGYYPTVMEKQGVLMVTAKE